MGNFSCISALVGALIALPMVSVAQTVGNCEPGQSKARLDINGVSATILNNGGLFWNRDDFDHLYNVPVGTDLNSISNAELWIGGKVDGQIRATTSLGTSLFELWPGPIDELGRPPADCSAYDRIFKVSRRDILRLNETGISSPDIENWPWQLGAPVEDGDGIQDNYDIEFGDRPAIEGDQSLWWIMNDLGNEHRFSDTPPLGLEIRALAFASSSPSEEVNLATYYRYTVINKGGNDIDSVYFGMRVNTGVGHVGDDYIGSDSLLGVAYGWNADDEDEGRTGYGSRPPAVGVTVVKGPTSDGRELGMTNMIEHELICPSCDFIHSGYGAYGFLRSRWHNVFQMTYGGTGRHESNPPAAFMYSGRPPEYWSEENIDGASMRNRPFDRDFIWSTGPFDLQAREATEIVIAFVWAQGEDRFDSVYKLLDAVPVVRAAYHDGFRPFAMPPPSRVPQLYSPDNGVANQPLQTRLSCSDEPRADGYEVEIFNSDTLVAYNHIRTRTFPGSVTAPDAHYDAELEGDRTYSWRVRPANAAGFGPWSKTRTFSTGSVELVGPGPLPLASEQDRWAFVQVRDRDSKEVCGPTPGSVLGCSEVGGDLVYGSYSWMHDWFMYREGPGPEAAIGKFAPHDFEIRVTDEGSYAYHPFDDGRGEIHWVPFETWDIGNVGPFGVNDTTDDVRLIPAVFSDSGGVCQFGFGEGPTDPFGLSLPATDRVSAYYPIPAAGYSDWHRAAEALVGADADGCPRTPTTDPAAALIDLGRGRPLQNLTFYMDPTYPGYRPEMIPVGNVIRFLTTKPVPPQPSSPASGAVVSLEVTLYWQMPPNADTSRVQVASTSDFESIVIDRIVGGNHFEARGLEEGTYHWRVSYGGEDWSEPWSFEVVPGTTIEIDGSGLPTTPELKPPYPNPGSGPRSLVYGVPGQQRVSLAVYDLLGRRVDVISDREQTAGWHAEIWNPKALSAGVYFIVLDSGSERLTQPVVVAR